MKDRIFERSMEFAVPIINLVKQLKESMINIFIRASHYEK